jgi:putative transposase
MGKAADFFISDTGANRASAADITYIPTWSGWLYLAIVLDVVSRQVIC